MLRRGSTLLYGCQCSGFSQRVTHVRHASSAARDPHAVLGVLQGASTSDLKRAYRDKALEHHPDRHSTEDRDASEAAFKEISQAYARLSADSGGPTIRDELTKEDAEKLFWRLFGTDGDGDHELLWRGPGRSHQRKTKQWQDYQALIEAGDDTEAASGLEARRLYRQCLRSLLGVDEPTAAAVREHARALFTAHADETDVSRIRSLLVDHHGQSAPLGSAPARLLRLLRARLTALGSSVLPE